MNKTEALSNLQDLSAVIEATKEAFEVSGSFNEKESFRVNESLSKAFYEVQKLHSDLMQTGYNPSH